jgi:osmoprotectant transport system permease protein
MMAQIMAYFQTSSDRWLTMLTDHVQISLCALLIATMIGVPAGVACVRFAGLKKYITAIFQILRVIPSLAVLLLLLPILGTGRVPATTALVILAIPPILMNTIAGLEAVPGFLLETAEGLGMEEKQVWTKVQFPLALPMILTGMKTAAVELVASATLAAKIGAGGFGDLIFTGIGLYRTDLLLIGGGTVAVLSLLTGFLFVILEKILFNKRR